MSQDRGARRRAARDGTLDATIAVRVQPRSGKDEVVGVRNGVVVIRVGAPPIDGRANDAVTHLLADKLGVPASRVTILRGQRSRDKVLRVAGLDPAAVIAALGV
jgi:uncharacterized protein (TIGR00251 family)